MKKVQFVINVLVGLFLAIAASVHVAGLFVHVSNESVLSHIVHLVSYLACMFAFLRPVQFRLPLYLLASVYPVYYHTRCFFTQLFELNKFNTICFAVIALLPFAAYLIAIKNKKRNSNTTPLPDKTNGKSI